MVSVIVLPPAAIFVAIVDLFNAPTSNLLDPHFVLPAVITAQKFYAISQFWPVVARNYDRITHIFYSINCFMPAGLLVPASFPDFLSGNTC